MDTMLSDIVAFCSAYGLSESQFGVLALNDKNFIPQFKSGRRIWPETEAKVRDFMATYTTEQQASAA